MLKTVFELYLVSEITLYQFRPYGQWDLLLQLADVRLNVTLIRRSKFSNVLNIYWTELKLRFRLTSFTTCGRSLGYNRHEDWSSRLIWMPLGFLEFVVLSGRTGFSQIGIRSFVKRTRNVSQFRDQIEPLKSMKKCLCWILRFLFIFLLCFFIQAWRVWCVSLFGS